MIKDATPQENKTREEGEIKEKGEEGDSEKMVAVITQKLSSLTAPSANKQSLSLTEKKALYNFWCNQWEIFRRAPANQNRSEKALRKKFDGYIPINIARYLTEEWNHIFAGRYVQDEREPRPTYDCSDLRAFTKRWRWLCDQMRFRPWPNATDDIYEDLADVQIEVRDSPFGVFDEQITESVADHPSSISCDEIATSALGRDSDLVSQTVLDCMEEDTCLMDDDLLDTAQSRHHSIRDACESYVVNWQGIMRNDPRFNRQVMSCMMQRIRGMEDQGILPSKLAEIVRALTLRESL